MEKLKDLAEFILKEAKAMGADDADVLVIQSVTNRVKVRLGKIEELKQANPKALGLRIFKNKRKALTYTSDFRPDSLKKLVKKTFEIALVSTPDDFAGLPDETLLGISSQNLDLYDPALVALPTEKKVALATELENIGLKLDPLITNSEGATWNDSQYRIVLANTRGFSGSQDYTSCSLSLALLAEKDGVKQSDYWYSSSRHFQRLERIEDIAREAVRRTIRKIGARKPKTTTVPVVFDPIAGRDLLNILASTVVGSAIYRKSSFLVDKLGMSIAVNDFNLIDDSLIPGGLASRSFDYEGLPGRKNIVCENGVLQKYLCDTYFARKLGLPATGNAIRSTHTEPQPGTTNFYMLPGEYTPEEIISSVKDGLYLTDVHWVGINYVTGDYSRGAEGIWIENGQMTYPVQEFTIASNVLTMLKSIEMIGKDLIFRDAINAPTIKISSMTISGT